MGGGSCSSPTEQLEVSTAAQSQPVHLPVIHSSCLCTLGLPALRSCARQLLAPGPSEHSIATKVSLQGSNLLCCSTCHRFSGRRSLLHTVLLGGAAMPSSLHTGDRKPHNPLACPPAARRHGHPS